MAFFEEIRQYISEHESNAVHTARGYRPLFLASKTTRILIIGQAPGIKAQESGIVWNDASGRRLRQWLGMDEKTFRDPTVVAHLPMDFYYPGKGRSGDLPPRKEFAPMWHDPLLQRMLDVQLTLLIGKYAQAYYLPNSKHTSLTETVRAYQSYLPQYFPIVHPSPLNFRWLQKNPWFELEVVPTLQQRVHQILKLKKV